MTEVTEATATYRKNNDTMLQFVTECIKNEEDEKFTLSLSEAFSAFTQWFRESFPTLKVLSKNDFRDDFFRKVGSPNAGTRWTGMRLRTIRDEVDEKKAIVLNPNALAKDENESDESVSSVPASVNPNLSPAKHYEKI